MSGPTGDQEAGITIHAPASEGNPRIRVSSEHMQQPLPLSAANIASQPADEDTNNKWPQKEERVDDMLERAPHLFRLVDLIQEDGLDGIVEKTVIDQLSLQRLLNTIRPGSCPSTTEIHFQDLDNLSIKPLGVYGDRHEILSFLHRVGCLDDHSYALMLGEGSEDGHRGSLSPGLYLALAPIGADKSTNNVYIVYWPEVTTWDDQNASPTTRHNRTVFMRYLTKLSDQVVALISSSQAEALVWDTESCGEDLPTEQTRNELRMPPFEVMRSTAHKSVSAQPGFKVTLQPNLIPKYNEASWTHLIPGEERVALMTVEHEEEQLKEEPFEERISALDLQGKSTESNAHTLELGDLQPTEIELLAVCGLRSRYSAIFATYDRNIRVLNKKRAKSTLTVDTRTDEKMREDIAKATAEIQFALRSTYKKLYPSLEVKIESPQDTQIRDCLERKYPKLREVLKVFEDEQNESYNIHNEKFQLLKRSWPWLEKYLTNNPTPSETEQERLVSAALSPEEPGTVGGYVTQRFSTFFRGDIGLQELRQIRAVAASMSDPDFIQQVFGLMGARSALFEFGKAIHTYLQAHLQAFEEEAITEHLDTIFREEKERLRALFMADDYEWYQRERQKYFEPFIKNLREAMRPSGSESTAPLRLVRINKVSANGTTPTHLVQINTSSAIPYSYTDSVIFDWSGKTIIHHPAWDHYKIYPLELNKENAQLGHKMFGFGLPEGQSVEFIQLIRDKCLVITSDPHRIWIYIEDSTKLIQVISQGLTKVELQKSLHGGSWYKFAFDEANRLLAIAYGKMDAIKLDLYTFDEHFTTLESRGSPISLGSWCSSSTDISRINFVPGLEEICIIDTSGHTRIYSVAHRHFRKGSLQIGQSASDAFPDLDRICLLIIAEGSPPSNTQALRVVQWASLQEDSPDENILITEVPRSDGPRVISRLGTRETHLISFLPDSRTITSTVLYVRQTGANPFQPSAREPSCNSLIDCHLHVWSQYPIAAPKGVSFLSGDRKPKQLALVKTISSVPKAGKESFPSIALLDPTNDQIGDHLEHNGVSEFKSGTYIQELLCLVPLHLVSTRGGQISFLDNGVWSSNYDLSLDGDIVHITDMLNFGWYEPLFQSHSFYKSVRVISSIGKSYLLDHFADTSFGVCSDRDSLGIWLSCALVDNCLLVVLDLKVMGMYNAAVSNLVILRNNFTITSYPSEMTMSMLGIVVNDISNPNTYIAVKEFSQNLQKLIQEKDERGVILALHHGGIQIMPWPNIGTIGFYTMIDHLRDDLIQQQPTHPVSNVLAHSMKILLAKVKARDWAPLDQSLASYRAKKLMESLPNALHTGQGKTGPLKNIQTNETLLSEHDHVDFAFWVPIFDTGDSGDAFNQQELAEQALAMRKLVEICGTDAENRQQMLDTSYVNTTQKGIHDLLEQRLEFVQQWVTVNTEAFPQDNPHMIELLQNLASAKVSMREATRICASKCHKCNLMCMHVRQHPGEHDCGTDHICIFDCELFGADERREPCGLPAGHEEQHMCHAALLDPTVSRLHRYRSRVLHREPNLAPKPHPCARRTIQQLHTKLNHETRAREASGGVGALGDFLGESVLLEKHDSG
ncbi:hypothetical protein B0J17DRAFT_663174 [Rhizoctonia solani]|nr:hypothetical protein B0J17DRAFT_663174 [Rhizoctonia solani]